MHKWMNDEWINEYLLLWIQELVSNGLVHSSSSSNIWVKSLFPEVLGFCTLKLEDSTAPTFCWVTSLFMAVGGLVLCLRGDEAEDNLQCLKKKSVKISDMLHNYSLLTLLLAFWFPSVSPFTDYEQLSQKGYVLPTFVLPVCSMVFSA